MQFKPGDYALTYASKFPENNMRLVRLVEYAGSSDPLVAVGMEWHNPQNVRAWVIRPEQGYLLGMDEEYYEELPWEEKRLIPLEGPDDPTVRTVARQRKQTSIA
jgi:hypothetical protein